jgi:hypothetical protein
MTCIKQLLSLSLFALGIFFSNAAQAQVCTPTIYLFRHAEDGKDKDNHPVLTNVGMRHAKLYPIMITQLQTVFHFCPIQRVFAMWDRDTGTQIQGTTNPYYTALPLAQSLFGESAEPEMSFVDTQMNEYQLCEYPIDGNCSSTQGYTHNGLANGSLFSYLIAYFQTHLTSSVAIFYTSQGMNPVSNVLGVPPVLANCNNSQGCTGETLPPTGCPLPVSQPTTDISCYNNANPILSWPGTQRSSVDIFEYSGENRFINQYNRITKNHTIAQNVLQNLKFYQCFNVNNSEPTKISTEYFCTWSGSIGKKADGRTDIPIPADVLSKLEGKICYAPNIVANVHTVVDSFGHCL